MKEVNSRAKIQSYKIKERNKPIDQKSHTLIPGRQIFTGHKFSPNKTSAVYEKISPRSDLRWKPTGRIFKSVGLRWLPTGKLFDSCTSTVESEPTHSSNVDISKIHERKQTLDLSAGTSINVPKEQNLYAIADQNRSDPAPECQTMALDQNSSDPTPECQTMALNHDSLSPAIQRQEKKHMLKMIKLQMTSLSTYSLPRYKTKGRRRHVIVGKSIRSSFDEYSDGENRVVSKPSAVTTADTSNKRQQQPDSTLSTSSLATTIIADGNFDL
nr:hypothetical protein [Tanacetum cinerariifolium]